MDVPDVEDCFPLAFLGARVCVLTITETGQDALEDVFCVA